MLIQNIFDATKVHFYVAHFHSLFNSFPYSKLPVFPSSHRYWCRLKIVIVDEKQTNEAKQVMVVQQADDGRIRAVTGMDSVGNLHTVEPTQQNVADLLNVNTQDSALETFFKKFMQEAENPSHKGIFIMAERALDNLIRLDFDPQTLEQYRVNPAEWVQAQEQRFEPLDTSKIDLDDLAKKGIRMEDIEPHLRAMSYGHKSNGLVDMNPELESGLRVATKGRVSLEEQADGSLKVIPHYWQERPNLDAPFHGVLLDDEVKNNFTNGRHAGKVLDLELEQGKLTPCYVSRDKWTNTLEYMPVELLEKRATIKNAELSEGRQIDFYGGRVLLEGYITRAGYKRDAYIQIDAAERNYEFSYDGLDRKRYQAENRAIHTQRRTERNGREAKEIGKAPELTIHHMILKAAVPDEATSSGRRPSKTPPNVPRSRRYTSRGW